MKNLEKLQKKIVTDRNQEVSFHIATGNEQKAKEVLQLMTDEELIASKQSITKLLKNKQRCYRILLHSTYGAFTSEKYRNLYDLLTEKFVLIEREMKSRT